MHEGEQNSAANFSVRLSKTGWHGHTEAALKILSCPDISPVSWWYIAHTQSTHQLRPQYFDFVIPQHECLPPLHLPIGTLRLSFPRMAFSWSVSPILRQIYVTPTPQGSNVSRGCGMRQFPSSLHAIYCFLLFSPLLSHFLASGCEAKTSLPHQPRVLLSTPYRERSLAHAHISIHNFTTASFSSSIGLGSSDSPKGHLGQGNRLLRPRPVPS